MVIANPALFWIASALPTSSGGHARADSAENCGESATTVTPHTTSNGNAAIEWSARNGKTSPQASDAPSAAAATGALPKRRLNKPPRMHPTAPASITRNDYRASFADVACPSPPRAMAMRKGVIVQNA